MAKKKQTPDKIFVKSPKIGETYYFYFAGGWDKGVCVELSEKLSDHYNQKWYTIENYSHGGRVMKYPVAIHNLRINKEDTKKK